MVIILVTVIVQSALTPKEARGSFNLSLLTVNDGIFQAIGVISFGRSHLVKQGRPVDTVDSKLIESQPSSANTILF